MSIEAIQEHAQVIQSGSGKIRPGEPYRINEAATPGDGVPQGDLNIVLVEGVPDGYVPAEVVKQLVHGNTIGARHSIKDPSTVSNFHIPKGWDAESLEGPFFRCDEDTEIEHPRHGNVTIAKGHWVQIRYQRNWDEIQKAERRAID